MRPGNRGAAIKLNGGDVLLDGEHFREKPQEAVTIALWVKLWRTAGMHSMFDTIGGHSIHNKGQYHFEVYDGRVRWFHRNEYAKEVFHIRTSPILQPNVWYHVAGTYDSRTHMARVYVNGDLVGEGHGSGLLSLDWGAKAGFGSHSGRRILFGYLDEIYIYRRALPEREIDRYLENPDRYSPFRLEPDSVFTDRYDEGPLSDSLSEVNTDSVWFSQPTTHLTDIPLPNISRNTSVYTDVVEEPSNARLGLQSAIINAVRPTLHTSNELQTTLLSTAKATETTATTTTNTQSTEKPKERPATVTPTTTSRPPPLSKATSVYSTCKLGNVYRNRDLVGGLGAGDFTDKGAVDNIEKCMNICCRMKDCSVAYMLEGNCFAISCKEKEQCKTFVKSPLENSPVIGFVDRFKPGGK